MAYLTDSHLKGLKKHKYACVGWSPLEKHVMQKWWNFLVELLPLWLAPNLITFIGLLVNGLSTTILIYYCPLFTGEAPSWAYLFSAWGTFIYQSLDAVDGKQARRTGTSSPLGELFDHGCDALSTVLYFMTCATSLQLGATVYSLTFFSAFIGAFYFSHWHAYVFGYLEFGVMDVTEAQIAIMSAQMINYIWGPEFWLEDMFGQERRFWIAIGGTLGMSVSLFRNAYKVLVVNDKPTLAGTSVISPLFPIMILYGLMFQTFKITSLYEDHSWIFILFYGSVFTKLTCALIVAHMCSCPLEIFDKLLALPLAVFINAKWDFVNPTYLLIGCCVAAGIHTVIYSTLVCREICDSFNIMCFTIPHGSSGSKASSSTRTSSSAGVTTRSAAKGTRSRKIS
eukprot:Nk52_evm40s230 gene=Nk52_evmTU40s230